MKTSLPLSLPDYSTTPAAPSAGFVEIYSKNGQLFQQTSGGTETPVSGGGTTSYLNIQGGGSSTSYANLAIAFDFGSSGSSNTYTQQTYGRYLFRRDTSTNWGINNPILGAGELALETDTKQFKIGDGSTLYTSLAYGGIQGTTNVIKNSYNFTCTNYFGNTFFISDNNANTNSIILPTITIANTSLADELEMDNINIRTVSAANGFYISLNVTPGPITGSYIIKYLLN